MPTPFVNEPFADFGDPAVATKMQQALDRVRGELGRDYPLIIDGREVKTTATISSIDPSNPDNVVGRVAEGTKEHAELALQAALERFKTWQHVAPEERASYLFKAAKVIRNRKFEYAAWLVFEVGKSWAEADADVAETIDFLEFYGREALRYASDQPVTKIDGEDNALVYIPLGAGVVIPPWNFPMAIMAGMTSAAIVAGNTVVLKPSSDSPVIAAKFVQVLQEVGLPAGVVNFVPGGGGEVGGYLVSHPKIRFIAFTGSKEVGLHINQEAATPRKGQIWIKRAILEMGGKDSIVIDDDADLDDAAKGVAAAAFGFQGQKCSACSRAIVHEKVYDAFVARLIPLVNAIKQGAPYESKENTMGPVVNEKAAGDILDYIETGKAEGKLLTGGMRAAGNGYFIQPTVFGDVPPDATISQEEIFGPVLALIRAKNFDDALKIANNTEFGLTGAVYSNNREHIERARREFHVGNLYFNRKCTGALVGVHPFGGFNMSGTDSKAGGRDYLLLFTQAKTTSEKNSVIFFSRGRGAMWTAVLVVAAIVRLVFAGAVVGFDTLPKADEADYHAIAVHLAAGEGFVSFEGHPTARRPPAYPVLLSAVYSIAGESPRAGRVAQVLLGVAVVMLTGRATRRLFGRTAGIVAAALAAINPFLVFISGYLLTENLYLVLLLGALVVARSARGLAASTRRALVVGALLGLATLARPSGLPMFEWFIAALLLLSPLSRHTRLIRAAALAIAFAAVVSPWYARNARVVGGWVLTTHGGVTFLQGNNEKVANTPQWRGGAAPLEVLPRFDELSRLDELSRDRLAWELGRDYLRTHPGDVPGLVSWKMVRYWRLKSDMGLSGIKSGWWFDKNSTLGRFAANVDVGFVYAIAVIPLFLVGVIVTARRWRDLALVYGVVVVHTAIAAVFFGSLRTRIPVEPVMCMLAAAAVVALTRRGAGRARFARVPPRT